MAGDTRSRGLSRNVLAGPPDLESVVFWQVGDLPYFFRRAWSFFNSGLTAPHAPLPQPDPFFFPKTERTSSSTVTITMARAAMLWISAVTSLAQ